MSKWIVVALAAVSIAAQRGSGQGPVDQYLMSDRGAEIALARSAAPDAISRDASVLVLGRQGYETAVKGTNGFVCLVERSWFAAVDSPEFWNPKIRSPDCLNPAAAHFELPVAYKKAALIMAGHSQAEVIDALGTMVRTKTMPALEPGAMTYMMSKSAYLTDSAGHNFAHIMFFMPVADSAAWGAGFDNSPVISAPYWSASTIPQLAGVPLARIFMIAVGRWSDGTPIRR
jgi:hypothetical protein